MLEIVLEERFPKPVKLDDGTRVILRPLIPQDESALVEFFKDMPEEDILYLRDDVKNPEVIKTPGLHFLYQTLKNLFVYTTIVL